MIKIILSENRKLFEYQAQLDKPGLAYWGSDGPEVQRGFKVPNFKPWNWALEDLAEQVRKKVNPQAPSRRNCKFVSPDKNIKGLNYEHIYEVAIKGKIFLTNLEWYTEANVNLMRVFERVDPSFTMTKLQDRKYPTHEMWAKIRDEDLEYVIEFLEHYWRGIEPNHASSPEILVDGIVVVRKKIK